MCGKRAVSWQGQAALCLLVGRRPTASQHCSAPPPCRHPATTAPLAGHLKERAQSAASNQAPPAMLMGGMLQAPAGADLELQYGQELGA